MSKNDDKLPIIMEYNNNQILLMEIILGKDGSIYFTFPRKEKYVLDTISEKKFYRSDYVVTKRTFDNVCKKYVSPRVSFHPGKMAVHINSLGYKVKRDYRLLNVASGGDFACYLMQVVFPVNFDSFDRYSKVKYKNALLINDPNEIDLRNLDLTERNLSLEIFIHSSNICPTVESLPRAKRDFKYMTTFGSPYEYTLTISVSQLINRDKTNDNKILVNINTKDKSLMYTLLPK